MPSGPFCIFVFVHCCISALAAFPHFRAPCYDRALAMKSESIAFGIAGLLFGLIAVWIIGSQQTTPRPTAGTPQVRQAGPVAAGTAPDLDEAKVRAFRSVVEREPTNAAARVQLGN